MASSIGNRLSKEKSPYLLQHAFNPVEWYPWGEEAFKASRGQNKLIFLSVGYSTCHWCHVMERESFESPEIAKIMNEHFINIKVDREERPDVDKMYMAFVTASSGHGGWPMSVFLTPDLTPVAGGTYFPPSDKYGRPGFPTVLQSISQKWKSDEQKFKDSARKIMEVLKKSSKLSTSAASDLPAEEVFAKAFSQFSRMYEPEYGGFGEAPKFPQPSNFNFLFAYKSFNPNLDDAQRGCDMCLHTLRMMSRGGICDHVTGGFARYSTDRRWHLPHFEKMLYDQAQLLSSFLDAYVLKGDKAFASVAEDIVTYVLRDLSHKSGGFFSAEDADSLPTETSERRLEGAFCVWTHAELKESLADVEAPAEGVEAFDVFAFHYSVAEGGNLDPHQDPHNELTEKNVLTEHGTLVETATEFGLTQEVCQKSLAEARAKLFEVRAKRPRPHLDDKMLTAWNGMMLWALSRAGAVLGRESYVQRAKENAAFLRKHLFRDGRLLRVAYKSDSDDETTISLGSVLPGFCDDYAWVVRGLISLYEATLDASWLRWAEELQDKQNEVFWDVDGDSAYFSSPPDDQSILLRMKDDHDGAEPSVNSVSCVNLLRLGRLLNRPDLEEKAGRIFAVFADRLTKVPVSLPEMATALLIQKSPIEQIILSGNPSSPNVQEMLRATHSNTLATSRLLLTASKTSDGDSLLYERHKDLANFTSDEAMAFVCRDFACDLPIKNAEALKLKLTEARTIQND